MRRMIITTDDQDREGDIVESAGCDYQAYMARNPIVLFAHDYSGGAASGTLNVIGRTHELGLGLHHIEAFYEFAPTPFAQQAKTLVDGGFLSTASIGFRSLANVPRDPQSPWAGARHTRWELLEWSIIPVPMNANASAIRAIQRAYANGTHMDVAAWARGTGNVASGEVVPLVRRAIGEAVCEAVWESLTGRSA